MGTIYNTSMKRTTQGDKTEKVGITLPIVLIKQTDKAHGNIPRSTFIRRAVEQFLRNGK
jgi:metal-responsive CopG/Arc/MetJ family transcriptional regulator